MNQLPLLSENQPTAPEQAGKNFAINPIDFINLLINRYIFATTGGLSKT